MSGNKNSTASFQPQTSTAKQTSCPVVANTTLLVVIAVLTVVLLIMSILLLILLTRRRNEKSWDVSGDEQQRHLTAAPRRMGKDEVVLLREFATNMQLSRSHVVPVLRHPKYECGDDVGRVDGTNDVGNNVTYLLLNSVIKRFE